VINARFFDLVSFSWMLGLNASDGGGARCDHPHVSC
jgi:hypothetical protein